ncbi:hypothetical protein BKA67DRAFT_528952 [Truncatella angustata]|uniref:histidine kinase n=1 Tax=Truncatella angustata TaxID=152316 RepID=A0A9P8UB58_9PEZI|nr:uncharacterized protein BKA67DRAFT_528952 [Truncatella angustata]KAH6638707.1 hypothetical protein BKA67DRAFT_528952 [Truncatella angustata]
MSVASRRSSSASSSEFARQRDLNRYYQPWLDSKKLKAVPVYTGRERTRCSHDTTLTALAQLAALRLNVKRAMISLIETNTQIILAEATQTLSLVDETRHDPGDHIWLGNVSLPRRDCMDEHALKGTTTCRDANGRDVDLAAFVVKDTFEDDRFKHRAYVTAERGVRFYAGVPIVTKQGHSIGVYGVSDTKPRPQGLTVDEILFMQDVAHIVAEHLDRVVDTMGRVSERDLMNGITYFLEDLSEFKYKLSNTETYTTTPESRYKTTDVQATDPQSTPSRGRGSQNHKPRSKDDPKQSENNIRRIFTQASQLLREQAKATGCVFVDVVSGIFSGPSDQGSSPPGNTDPDTNSEFVATDDEDYDMDIARSAESRSRGTKADVDDKLTGMAEILSTALAYEEHNAFSQGIVRRKNLKKCILKYPFGKCFYLNKGRVVADQKLQLNEDYAGEAVYEAMPSVLKGQRTLLPPEVLESIPDAKWLIFLPLFNYAHSQWFAAGFIWGDDFKMGDPDEALPYFKTFGSCMMSEVASMEVLNTNIAKSTFIASISHDLRSPLHGMLGSLEFLEDTMTSAYQMSLVGSMETCGKTLLDTIDHLLDYAKINNLNRASTALEPTMGKKLVGDRGLVRLASQENLNSTAFDFSLLLEEVVEAVFAGQTFRKMNLRHYDPVDDASAAIKAMALDDSPAEEQIHSGSAKFSGKVQLTINIEKSPFWNVRGHTGALRRAIMNVVGNAIKYCKCGSIEIFAKVHKISSSDVEVKFAVKDTGIGMSEDFMANRLFKAFAQEDSFTPGTGLGLSITSQIVDNLGGKINIHSEKGVGTHVHISIPMKAASSGISADNHDDILNEVHLATSGKKVCMLNPTADDAGDSKEQRPSKLESSVMNICEKWFDMNCVRSRNVSNAPDTSVYIYAEPPPIEYLVSQHRERIAAGHGTREAALLIICTNAFEAAALRAAGIDHLISLGRIIEVVSQPAGLRKLAKAMVRCIKRVQDSGSDGDEADASDLSSSTFSTGNSKQRAAGVKLNTSSVVYDKVAVRYRPSPGFALEPGATTSPTKSVVVHQQEEPSRQDALSPPRVLLVDDNAINLKLLVTFMKKIQLPYAEASNGLEAFTKYKEADSPFEYILMDLQMPIMDGFEATKKIREYEQEQGISKASTIIAITGVGSENACKEAGEVGMSRFLTKPVKFKELKQLLISR